MSRGSRKRTLAVALVALLACGLLGGGWLLAQLFRSPQQIAAEGAEPTPAVVTATVLDGTLTRDISVQASVARSQQETLVLPSQTGDVSVVTKSPWKKGDTLSAASLVVEMNGEPIFYLPGRFVFYRDIYTGDRGPDVEQLQRALAAAGYSVDVDGVAGGQTLRAMRQMYSAAGYSLPVREAAPEETEPPAPAAPEGEATPQPQEKPKKPAPPALVMKRVHTAVATDAHPTIAEIPSVGKTGDAAASASLLSGGIRLLAEVSPETAAMIRPDAVAAVLGEADTRIDARVGTVDSEPNEAGLVGISFEGDDAQLEQLPVGETVVVMLNLAEGAETREGSVIVPSLGVITRGGGTFVRKAEQDGGFREVAIDEIDSAGGQSMVVPLTPGELRVGDVVRVQ